MRNDDARRTYPVEAFVGRKHETHQLETAFNRGIRVAVVRGPPGCGKTLFVHNFLHNSRKFLAVPFLTYDVFYPKTVAHALDSVIRRPNDTYPDLSVIDEIDPLTAGDIKEIESWVRRNPNAHVIFTSRHSSPVVSPVIADIELGPLTLADFDELIRARLGVAPDDRTKELYRRLEGNPRLVISAISEINQGKLSWDDLLRYINSFEYSGIVGVDGRPLSTSSAPFREITVDVRSINTDVLKRIKGNPEAMRQLSARQFEELIADLLYELGYTVDLTQQTRDGGFDIYAAKKEPIGSFLYLVECKKYTPPNKVGVDVVRALYGVVETEKATAGIVASSSFFTSDAREFQQKHIHELQLKDYIAIQEWLNQTRL